MTSINDNIDKQHNDIINGLNSLLNTDMKKMEDVKIAMQLCSYYINEHFKSEEELMLGVDYLKEAFEKHRSEHKRLSLDYQKLLLKSVHSTIHEYFPMAHDFVESFLNKIEFHIEFFDAPIKEWIDNRKL